MKIFSADLLAWRTTSPRSRSWRAPRPRPRWGWPRAWWAPCSRPARGTAGRWAAGSPSGPPRCCCGRGAGPGSGTWTVRWKIFAALLRTCQSCHVFCSVQYLELSLPSVVSSSILREWQKFDLLDLKSVISNNAISIREDGKMVGKVPSCTRGCRKSKGQAEPVLTNCTFTSRWTEMMVCVAGSR